MLAWVNSDETETQKSIVLQGSMASHESYPFRSMCLLCYIFCKLN